MRFAVVVNDEEQYSVWPADRAWPPGWQPVGHTGTRAECLSWIAVNWTDQRPRSLRSSSRSSLSSSLRESVR